MISPDQNHIHFVQQKPSFWTRRNVTLAIVLGLLIPAVLLASSILAVIFLVQPVFVDGNSMAPTLNKGDRVFIQKSFSIVERGDIVAFWYPQNPQHGFIKRIIGVPNDVIQITGGKVSINGQSIAEPYLAPEHNAQQYNFGPQIVPVDSYFVMGDNRDSSNDSRAWGCVERKLIYGKVIGRYYSANSK